MRLRSPALPVLAALVFLAACAQLVAPVANVNFLAPAQEREIADQFAAQVQKQQPVVTDAVLTAYLQKLGDRLEQGLPRPEFDYQFRLVRDEAVNAFNIGGGYVYVHTGLLKTADTEGQLVSVLAHEMGHQVHRHVAKAISRDQLFNTLAQVAVGSNASQWLALGANLGITTGQLYFGREAERQADDTMVALMVQTLYDPNEALAMFAKLEGLDQSQPSRVAMLFSSHPPTGERIENVRRAIAAAKLPANLYRDSSSFHEAKKRLP